ncbi:DUF4139 domain-containing protein [Allosphingosinicella vermicomposti]|uniref:DUF4139 domain-containing protein n=1 Tax=Allosphingosinicella vermicomposti TaxID=614671 RepID=UPI000D0ECD80|nr:DUF4139 domain-containing protein [Allosphingosinicella vermicomposti]
MRHLLLVATILSGTASAQTAQGDVSVTIYNNDVALVQDVRQLDLPARRVRQEFPDVSGRIQAETVSLAGDGIGIVEQNFDYDLLSPSALMQKAVGETVTLVRTNPATGKEERERAKVLAANGGVVLQIGQRIEVLRDDGLPVRVIFDKVPENLRARPTLSVTLESDRAGQRPVRLSYLTGGLDWNADYVVMFDDRAGRIDVQGWVTLTNNSGTTYNNASTILVAGGGGEGYSGSSRSAGTETADRERLGDLYLYPLSERTTIADRQTKQVSFLDVSGAPAARAYEYRNGWLGTRQEPGSANSVLRFSTSRDQGLGDALPAGTVRVYMRDARGNAQFIGENNIGHTAMGSSIGLKTGDAFDVKVQPVVERRERINNERWRTTMRYTLSNARPEPVTVDLVQGGLDHWADTRIIEESLKSERRNAGEAVWSVPIPANGTATVTATFDTRF